MATLVGMGDIDDVNYNYASGVHFGLSYLYRSKSEFIIFEPGIRYIEKGVDIKGKLYDYNKDGYVKIDEVFCDQYLESYIKIKYDLVHLLQNKLHIHPFAGFGLSVLLNSTNKTGNVTDDRYKGYRQYPLMLGIDYLHNNRISLGFEFMRDLNTSGEGIAYNQAFNFTLGYKF